MPLAKAGVGITAVFVTTTFGRSRLSQVTQGATLRTIARSLSPSAASPWADTEGRSRLRRTGAAAHHGVGSDKKR